MKEEVIALIRYRIQEAFESIEEGDILLNQNKVRGAMNRIYYSMFYAALGLLAVKQLGASKHSGVISLFHREFVKNGLFPKDLAKFLDIAFDLRTKSDYRGFVTLERERVYELLKEAISFVEKAQKVAEELISKEDNEGHGER